MGESERVEQRERQQRERLKRKTMIYNRAGGGSEVKDVEKLRQDRWDRYTGGRHTGGMNGWQHVRQLTGL